MPGYRADIYRRWIASQPRAYKSWQSMKQRCLNPNNKRYAAYGGRGITICERWLEFANFYAEMGDRPVGLTLERKDNSRGYEPGNCVWATYKEQANNRRNNRHHQPLPTMLGGQRVKDHQSESANTR